MSAPLAAAPQFLIHGFRIGVGTPLWLSSGRRGEIVISVCRQLHRPDIQPAQWPWSVERPSRLYCCLFGAAERTFNSPGSEHSLF